MTLKCKKFYSEYEAYKFMNKKGMNSLNPPKITEIKWKELGITITRVYYYE